MQDASNTASAAGLEPDGGLGEEEGNPTVAQVLGFKFAYYQVRRALLSV